MERKRGSGEAGKRGSGYALERAKEAAAAILRSALPEDAAVSVSEFEEPPQKEMGDLAYPCFPLAKLMKKSPADVAKGLAVSVGSGGLIASAEAVGPYVNFRLDRDAFSRAVLEDVIGDAAAYGGLRKVHPSTRLRAGKEQKACPAPERSDWCGGQKLIVEYGQPNTHKEVHVGHLRNFFLGLSVVRLARATGNTVITSSYIGDVGTHVAKCLWAYRKFHDGERPEKGSEGKFLGGIYTEASRRIEEDESLKEEVSAVQRALESGDPEWIALWKETRQWSLDEMYAIFAELGCEFDRVYFESEVEEPGKKLVRGLLKKGVAKESQGAVIMDFESEGLGVFLLLKSDGSSLYATKELALAKLKFSEYKDTDASIHIVDVRQSLYFQQLFRTLQIMGFDKRMVHLSYDFVTLKEGAMSSRKGNVITYGDFRREMVRRAADETEKRHGDWDKERIASTAWTIAEGAAKFGMLKQDNDKPIVFDVDSALAFDGFTGPYVQYAHARMSSILGKAGSWKLEAGSLSDFTPEEFGVLRKVAAFPEVVAAAAREFRPSLMAQYAFELAQDASAFYRDVPVLNAGTEDRERRLAMVRAIRATLARALLLLGIRAPDEM